MTPSKIGENAILMVDRTTSEKKTLRSDPFASAMEMEKDFGKLHIWFSAFSSPYSNGSVHVRAWATCGWKWKTRSTTPANGKMKSSTCTATKSSSWHGQAI